MIVSGLINGSLSGLNLGLIEVSARIIVAAVVAIVVAGVEINGCGFPFAFGVFMASKGIEAVRIKTMGALIFFHLS